MSQPKAPRGDETAQSVSQDPRHFKANAISQRRGKNTVMASHGRAPWYTPDGRPVPAYVIGIAGGSASGKTSVARAILSALGYIPTVLILSQDAFYRAHTPEEVEKAFNNDLDVGESCEIQSGALDSLD
jgi:Ni2+-binding GTPase involved in maturation of urease and hydrogenase